MGCKLAGMYSPLRAWTIKIEKYKWTPTLAPQEPLWGKVRKEEIKIIDICAKNMLSELSLPFQSGGQETIHPLAPAGHTGLRFSGEPLWGQARSKGSPPEPSSIQRISFGATFLFHFNFNRCARGVLSLPVRSGGRETNKSAFIYPVKYSFLLFPKSLIIPVCQLFHRIKVFFLFGKDCR